MNYVYICKEKTIRTENAYSSFKALDRIKKMQKLFFLHAELRVEVLHFIRFFFHWPSKEMS